jgi:hypothetical protein
MSLPKCYFNYSTLIAKVGNSYKGYEELKCVQVTPFTKQVKERESLGEGWYGSIETVTKTFDSYFVILKDDKPFGVLLDPYHEITRIKSDIHPLDCKWLSTEIKSFILKLTNYEKK